MKVQISIVLIKCILAEIYTDLIDPRIFFSSTYKN